VLLKDRSAPPVNRELEDDMKLWYNRAFGPLRNIMTMRFRFSPGSSVKMQARYFVELSYEPFPEMEEEFPAGTKFAKIEIFEMFEQADEDDPNRKTWQLVLDRPYGDYKAICKYKPKLSDNDDQHPEELPNE
jgi:hypothetical protein